MKNRLLLIFTIFMLLFCINTEAQAISKTKNVPNIKLNNGRTIPQLGFGTWTLKGDIPTKSVKQAIKSGYRMIDTAQANENEEAVFKGIKFSNIKREDVFITTKSHPIICGITRLGNH